MKKLFTIVAVSVCCMLTPSCAKKDNSITVGNANSPAPLSGSWKLTYYSAQGNVGTADFSTYTFDFKPKEAITATIGGQTSNGYWSMSANEGVRVFSIAFNSGDARLATLNSAWTVKLVSETVVELIDGRNDSEVHFARQ